MWEKCAGYVLRHPNVPFVCSGVDGGDYVRETMANAVKTKGCLWLFDQACVCYRREAEREGGTREPGPRECRAVPDVRRLCLVRELLLLGSLP